MDAIRVDKYTLLKVEDNGEYGWKLMEGWENQAGEFKPNFCKRSFKKGGEEKNVPVTVKLGDKVTATATLLMILKEITGQDYNIEEPF
jgi:hypothetical protein